MPESLIPPGARRAVVPGFDPQVQPVVPGKALPPLSEASLQLDFIRSAFRRKIDWRVEPIFTDSFRADFLEDADVRPAAVFFPLIEREGGLHVLFTRRSSHLYNHAGQICFPGGRVEAIDLNPTATALRETQEEIGVDPKFIELIGTHPGFLTSTRFTMKPVIGLIKPGFTVKADPTEVAEVFEVPLSVLMDTARHRLHQAELSGGAHRYYFSITWQTYFIWGATAALIRNFYHFLAAAQAHDVKAAQ